MPNIKYKRLILFAHFTICTFKILICDLYNNQTKLVIEKGVNFLIDLVMVIFQHMGSSLKLHNDFREINLNSKISF